MAMTLFGLAALIAPIVGPTLGGWITDSYSWRWVFWINVPAGLLALGACAVTLRDPDYLTAQRAELRRRPFSFDGVGLSLLVVVIVCWEVVLSKGQEWDWLGDPFWRVQTLAIFFATGLTGLIFWELRHPIRWSISVRCESETSSPAASSSFAPSRCCMPPAPPCLPCCSRCSATMRCTPDWSCRLRASPPSLPWCSWGARSVAAPMRGG